MTALKFSKFLLYSLCLTVARAARVNRTIDDTNGDSSSGQVPVYRPISAWDGPGCSTCAINPSTSLAHDGTWTAATYNPDLGSVNVSFSFEGVALYIYFILANNAGTGITTRTESNFTLDAKHAGAFVHVPDAGSTALEYGALAFSVEGLEQGEHRVVISTEGVGYSVFVNFDYAVYTYDDDATATSSSASATSTSSPESSSSTGSSTGGIVGGVLGGLLLLAAIGLAVFFFLKRRRQQPMTSPTDRYGHQNGNSQSLLPLASASEYNFTPTPFISNPAFNSSPTEYNPTAFNSSSPIPTLTPYTRSSSSYIPKDIVSSLPSGAIVISAASSSSSSLPPGAAPPASIHTNNTRQQALQAQMRVIQNEMAEIQPRTGRDEEMDDLKAQIAAMREQMQTLQQSQEPPPGYTPGSGFATPFAVEVGSARVMDLTLVGL